MKIFFTILIFLITLNSCISDKISNSVSITADLIDPENPPIIDFQDLTYNFDTVALGSKVQHSFIFTNIGKTPLLINSV